VTAQYLVLAIILAITLNHANRLDRPARTRSVKRHLMKITAKNSRRIMEGPSMAAAETKVPLSATLLGGLGAAPFIGLSGTIPFLTGNPRMLVVHALVAYGATILSFLGGIHWGLAIGSQKSPDIVNLKARLTLSVIPSLAGWAALLVAETLALYILAIAIAAMLWFDIRATRIGYAPPWYPKLRIPLTCVVVATLLFGAIV